MKSPQYTKHELSGLILDIPPEQIPVQGTKEDQDGAITWRTAWTSGANIKFKDRAVERAGGYGLFAEPPTNPPDYILHVLLPLVAYWIYTTANNIYVTDGSNHFDITPAGGMTPSAPGDWTGGILNGLPFLNNTHDAPWWWDGVTANPMQLLPGWPALTTCRALRSFRYHLVAMHITQNSVVFPEQLLWSNGADPGAVPDTWAPAPDNEAGSNILASTQGGIVDGEKLRDQFIIYKDHTSYIMTYVGGQYVFAFRKLFLTSGIQANNCVAEMNGRHYVFTGDDVIKHDGNQFESIVTWKVKQAILRSIDPDFHHLCIVKARHSTDEIWICVPETGEGSLTAAWVINTITDDVGLRILPGVSHVERGIVVQDADLTYEENPTPYDSDTRAYNQQAYSATADGLLMADKVNTHLLSVDTLDTNAGEDVAAFVERTGMDLGNWVKKKVVTAIYPRITGQVGQVVNIRLGVQDLFGEAIEWGSITPFTIGSDVQVNVFSEGRLFAIRFESVGGLVWKLHRFTFKWVEQGLY